MKNHDPKGLSTVPSSESSKSLRLNIASRVILSVMVIAGLVVGVGGWAALAEISGAVISSGTVIVDGRAKKIQHRDGGIIAEIRVKDGDRVEKGAVLVVLDDTQTRSELAIIQSQLVEFGARHARLIAERNSDERVAFPDALISQSSAQAVLMGEQRLFDATRQTRESQKEQLRLRIDQLGKESEGVSAQRSAKSNELQLIEKELLDIRKLFEKNLTPASRVYALEREQTRLSGELGNLVAQGARIEGQISEIKLQILNIDQSARTDAQREARNTEARIAELREREVAQRDRLGRMEIRAPQSGIVHDLQAHTIGGVVSSAEAIMMIVPDDRLLAIQIRISPAEIDQVHVGQDVRLRFTAFNQRTTPEKTGRVSFVSADVTYDQKSRAEYYTGTVELDKGQTFYVGDRAVLPGMPVEAFITTGRRTALSYLIKPLTDHFSRAMREE